MPERRVRPLGVVAHRPRHRARPGRPRRSAKTRPVRNSWRSVRWNRSIFPVVVGRPRCGQQVLDAVLPADPVEQHLGVLRAEPAGEHLAVVGQDLLRHPVAAHRARRSGRTPPGGWRAPSPRRRRTNREWSSIPVSTLHCRPSARHHPADDVHLPQLHRSAPLPPLEPPVATTPACGSIRFGPLQRPVDPRAGGHRVHACARRPRARAGAGPSPGCVGALSSTQTSTLGSIWCEHLGGRWDRSTSPAQALVLVPPQPPVDRLARDAEAGCHLHDRNAIADHREHCLIPLLHDTQLHQHARECVADQAEPASPIRRSRVTHQPEPICHASGGTKHRSSGPDRTRTCDARIKSPLL